MNDTTHTPGPWSVTSNQVIVTVTPQSGGIPIAYLQIPKNPRSPQETLEGALANARLIAAAPELLAVCEMTIEELCNNHETTTDSECEACRAIIKDLRPGFDCPAYHAKRAVAKATGKATP